MKSKTLIITAHPSSTGFTHAIAQVVKEKKEEICREVEILDLYNTDLNQDYLRFENIQNLNPDPFRSIIQEKIMEASEIIFIHPLWWLAQPAIMKNFIDQNFTSRFAYKYIKGKRVGLLKGKTTRVYVTCDAPIWVYVLLGFPFVTMWVAGILIFCGFTVEGFSITRMRSLKTETQRSKKLAEIKKNANKKSFILRAMSIIGNL